MKKIVSALLICIFYYSNAFGQLQTKTVSIFKNNNGFFIKSGNVTTKGNTYLLEGEIPRALFGTFWFQSPNNNIKLVSSNEENIEKIGQPLNHYEILKANINKKVFLYLSNTEMIEGVIISFSKTFDEENKSYFPAAFVTIKSADKWQIIKIEDIKRIGFAENPVNTVSSFDKKKRISVEFNDNKTSQALNVMYLEDGIGWSPNYLLELTSENKGILTLQAQVKNDAEDILNTDVSFVVGNANFKDANNLAWLVDFLPPTVRDNYVNPGTYSNAYSYKSVESADVTEESSPADGVGVDGETNEDLFFYTLKNLSLPKASRTQLELFKADITFEHIYDTRLLGMAAYDLENNPQQAYGNEEKGAKTFHSLKLINQTKYPWTSGLCFVVNNEKGLKKPLSQDKMPYIPIKGDNFLKLTESPDIKVEQTEKEVSRKTGIRKSRDFMHDQINVEAEIKITNYKNKDIKMNLKRVIIGDILKSSISWTSQEKLNYGSYLNKSSDVTWETSVKAGETVVIKYSYTMIIRGL